MEVESGLRKSVLDAFTESVEQSVQAGLRNAERAAELVTSFKHVASDQTSSLRRVFDLSETLRDVLLTLQPMIKKTPHTVKSDIPENIILDSYPGILAQVITNLISNALSHAWHEGETGTIYIYAELGPSDKTMSAAVNDSDASQPVGIADRVKIRVADNGHGIPSNIEQKIFDPFFTTKMGRGGTGRGLHVAHNGVRNVLGGILDFENRPGNGCVFTIDIPLCAPTLPKPV
jgi:signal transduction histidine kinase